MEDEKIKKIFSDFEPELSSSFQFMTRLQKNMEAIEIVKQYQASLKRRNRIAVAVASLCGFAMGVILTLLFPLISDWISTFSISLPYFQIKDLTIDFSILYWMILASVSALTALNAYEITLTNLSVNHKPQIRS